MSVKLYILIIHPEMYLTANTHPLYTQNFLSGSSVDVDLFENRSRMSLSKKPAFILARNGVLVSRTNVFKAASSMLSYKSPPGYIFFVHSGKLQSNV